MPEAGISMPDKRDIRKYSVLLPLFLKEGQWHVLYEVRSRALRAHSGEISFPGGEVEPGETLLQAAVRETAEEVGVPASQITVLGDIEGTAALKGFWIHCYIGVIETGNFSPSACEVDTLFAVPLDYLLHCDQRKEMLRTPDGREVESYLYEYEGRRIWGITGRLTRNFVSNFTRFEKILEEAQGFVKQTG